ncbi:MAG: electron transport complex subunit RsxB [Kangiellaceae bacterium]|jgi:electron transport complex protein RnfB|nr:electron transport complex subunit RsxB [Kangiellaceae bacterium]
MSTLTAVLILVAVTALLGALLGFAAQKFKVEADPIVEQIDNVLPQTQCGQCGYPGCRPYAEAIANGDEINKCPPGGEAGVKALADLLGREVIPLDETLEEKTEQTVVVIREDECIGCTKCIQACPVDAIVGAAKFMHTVIESECTGCDLCIPPCPVDCIDIVPLKKSIENWQWPNPQSINNAAAIPVRQID